MQLYILALENKLSVSCDQIEILQSQVQESVERAQNSEQRGSLPIHPYFYFEILRGVTFPNMLQEIAERIKSLEFLLFLTFSEDERTDLFCFIYLVPVVLLNPTKSNKMTVIILYLRYFLFGDSKRVIRQTHSSRRSIVIR